MKKSKYARKLRRKLGSGSRDPRWMWWSAPAEGDRPIQPDTQPGPVSHLNHERGFRNRLLGRTRLHRKLSELERRRSLWGAA